MNYIILSTLPFLVAISLIIWKEEPILPLVLSIFMALWLFYRFNPITAFLNLIGNTVANSLIDPDNILLIILITEVLVLFYLFREGNHFKSLKNTKQFKNLSKYSLEYIVIGLSFLLSFEEKLSTIINGVFLKSFVKEKNISKERFSFIINNIGPAFYTLIPLTLFTPIVTKIIGASLTSLGIDYHPLKIYLFSLPFQFYNIFILFIIASSSILKRDILPMKIGTNNKNVQPLIIAPVSRTNKRKNNKIKNTLYSAGISFIVTVTALLSAATILLTNFYSNKPVDVLNFKKLFTSIIFGGILYYIIYSLIIKTVSIRELSIKNNGNSSTLIVIFYIVLSSSLLFISKRLGYINRVTSIIFENSKIELHFYPLIFFLLSSVLSFLTGSRIAVLYVIIPLAFKAISASLSDPLIINYFHYAVLGAIISGSSFGFINSPLSPIFIISTSSSESSIRTHFTSQIYYSLGALFCSLLFGYLLSFLKISPYLTISIGLIVISSFFTFGKNFLIST